MNSQGFETSTQSSALPGSGHPATRFGSIEWPTIGLAAALYLAFGLLTYFYAVVPWWLLAALGGYLVALHGSLTHEVIHGHPTRLAWLNRLFVLPSLCLVMPFALYRESHLAHHRDENLTDPLLDPESFYLTAERWARIGPVARAVLHANNSLLGRLSLGPLLLTGRVLLGLLRDLARRERDQLLGWAQHGVAVALTLAWVVGVCGLPIWLYLLCFAYPGLALTLLRSFLEHRAHPDVSERTAIVESGPLGSLLFLNNNLHWLHHRQPGLPWYRLPARWRATREAVLQENGGYYYADYGELFRRYSLRAKEPVVHPFETGPQGVIAGEPLSGLPATSGASYLPPR
jgi:fatty acid desaturase